MKIHEYQGKELLRRFDVKVPRGKVARSVAEAEEAAKELGLPVVVKAQIHAGGRGKGGGVKLARTMEDAQNLTRQMIGMNLVTPPDRAGRPRSSYAAHRGRTADQAGVLSGNMCLTAPRRRWSSWLRPPAVWTSRRSRQKLLKRS